MIKWEHEDLSLSATPRCGGEHLQYQHTGGRALGLMDNQSDPLGKFQVPVRDPASSKTRWMVSGERHLRLTSGLHRHPDTHAYTNTDYQCGWSMGVG